VLKKFYKWLKGTEDEYPPEVKWMKTSPKSKDIPALSQTDLITPDEIKNAINACDHPRNKAFLSLLAESGCRIGEIGTLLIRNITFDKYGTILTVHAKTGSRQIRVINATPYLATWLNCRPYRTAQKLLHIHNIKPRRKRKNKAIIISFNQFSNDEQMLKKQKTHNFAKPL